MTVARITGRSQAAQEFRATQVLRVARQLANDGGYEAVQMREVARRANVVLATLYRYYPSKDVLIQAMIGEELRTLVQVVVSSPPRHASAHMRAAAVVVRAFRTMRDHRGFAHAAMTALHTPRPFSAEPLQEGPPVEETRFVDIVALAAWGLGARPSLSQSMALDELESVLTISTIAWLDGSMSADEVERRIRFSALCMFGPE